MGLLDSVIGALGQSRGSGSGSSGGGQAALLQAVIGMLMQGGGQGGGQGGAQGGGQATQAGGLGAALGGLGGLGGLVAQFTQHGMGEMVRSWVGSGQNLPVSPDQISQVLGNDTIGRLAQQLGLGQGEVAGQLSEMLPQVIDRMTPQGQLPQGNDLSALGDIDGLLGGLLRR